MCLPFPKRPQKETDMNTSAYAYYVEHETMLQFVS